MKALLLFAFILAFGNEIAFAKHFKKVPFLERKQPPLAKKSVQSSQPSLVASPNVIDDGQQVTVQWSGISYRDGNDSVAIYCPFEGSKVWDFIENLPVGNQQSGSGSLVFSPLINMRCVYGFRYLQMDKNRNWYSVAKSDPVTQKHPNVPQYGHIALGSNIDEMRIMWTSPKHYTPLVKYGTHPSRLVFLSTGTSHTYTADMMCGPPANLTLQQAFRDPGYMNDVLLSDLLPATTYFYVYGSNGEPFSSVSSFTTPAGVGRDIPVKFVAYGDLGVAAPPAAMTTIAQISENLDSYNFLIHYGDISYALGSGYTWEAFFKLIEPVARRIPYMITIGNHEYDHTSGGANDPSGAGLGFHPSWGNYHDDSCGECSVPMYYRFHMPDNGKDIYWYSFEYGNVHMTMISTEHDYTPGSEQYLWLENDLKSVNRSRTPWLIVAGHRPMYTSENCSDDTTASDFFVSLHIQKSFEDLLYKYKVDLALWGHQHSYEMTCAVYKQKCVKDGIVHVVAGNAGAGLEPGEFYLGTGHVWSQFHWVDWGFVTIETDTSGHLNLRLLSNEDGSVVQDLTLKSKF